MLILGFSTDPQMKTKIAQWVTKRVMMTRVLRESEFEMISVIRVEEGKSTVIAGVLFHDYMKLGDGGKIEVSMAAEDPRWARPGIIRGILHYPFVQLGCHVLIATTTKMNKRTRRFLEGLGFKERGIIPNRPYADDTVIYALRREDAEKWLKVEVKKAA